MNQMIVTFEWDETLGPRWMNKENLETLLFSPDQVTENDLIVKSVSFPGGTPKERAQEEFEQLSRRLDKLDRMSYGMFMSFGEDARMLLHNQYMAMEKYSQTLLARINQWTDETS